jgi:hypothetical protein
MEGLTGYNRIRTHEMDHIPYPESSVRFASMPNACNACHTDRDAEWSALWTKRWWGPRERVGEEIERRLEAYRRSGPAAARRTDGL